ncbi:hypothetical protein MKW94_012856 [Papaver nudicaule]|uniref:N-acetyltransferase domain-containing protein n=1 Tax=Papaver nudicaule TaxID=74823 RepID=A0AA41W1N0_PAPNU|nr:hypothetical protein [Papaver nudicaule]
MLMSMNVFHQTTTPKLLNFPSVSCHERRRSSSSHFLVSSPATTMEFNSKFLNIHSCLGIQHSSYEPVLGSPATMKFSSAVFALPRDDEEFSSDNEEFLSYDIIFRKIISTLFALPRDDEEFSSHNEEFLSYNELSDNDDLSDDEDEPMSQKLEFVVREATIKELWASARLKAEGLYEYQPNNSYVRSCKKKHADQEFYVMCGQWTQALEPVTFIVAVRKEGENLLNGKLKKVVGTLDFCIKYLLEGETYPQELVKPEMFTAFKERGSQQCVIISKVTVSKSARRQGVGTSMLKFVIEYAKENSVPKIFLQVRRDNKPALALCGKMGFTILAEATAEPFLEANNLYLCSKTL